MKCWQNSYKKKEVAKMNRLDKIIAEKSYEAVFKDQLKRSKAFDACILLTLNGIQHHTAEWLENYYKSFIDNYEKIVDNYGMGDAVISKLKDETGIDMDDMYAKYIDENDFFEKSPEAKQRQKEKQEIEDLRDENEVLKKQIEVLKKLAGVEI